MTEKLSIKYFLEWESNPQLVAFTVTRLCPCAMTGVDEVDIYTISRHTIVCNTWYKNWQRAVYTIAQIPFPTHELFNIYT